MNVLIVDDEPLARTRLRTMLAEVADVHVVAECESAEAALRVLARESVDVVFLDIQMPGLGGLGLASELGGDDAPFVVFVTAHSEHALEAFELAATDYLLKPFSRRRLDATLERLRTRSSARPADIAGLVDRLSGHRYLERVPIPGRSKIVFVEVADIDRVEADGNYVVIHAGGQRHLLRGYLREMAERLDPADFVRIHRSHVVRRRRIRELRIAPTGARHAVLTDGQILPVGRTYAEAISE